MRLSRLCAVLFLLTAVTALAQNNRSFVSTTGSDANDCTVGHDCRSFTRALAVTNSGGEILALTSGGYGPMSITQAVSILATTGAASITVTSGNGVVISAGASDRIVLKGLSITQAGGLVAVYAIGYGDLSIDNCTVTGGVHGIYAGGDASSMAMISDTTVRDENGDGFEMQAPAVLVRCRSFRNGGSGLNVYDSMTSAPKVVATDFISAGGEYGVQVVALNSGHDVEVALDHAVLSHSAFDGVRCGAIQGSTAHVSITNSSVVYNGLYGLNADSGSISSMKNNMVIGNSAATNGTIDAITAE
jgi:hypothetical protein